MITIERQVHGYRHGHQLLAGSLLLSNEDQSTVDRLSDIAGPLRPRESFEPYLTAYPLPSGQYYVLARTWQDLTVPRAGCVRTLSLLLKMSDWLRSDTVSGLLELLEVSELPSVDLATRVIYSEKKIPGLALPATEGTKDLVEALFLEESRPVVVFGAVNAELISTRLLTAMWPSMRRSFALSTFALAPRKIGGRDFSLVFAPSDARAKFSDWPGRRVDGRLDSDPRHKWTSIIARRVFEEPNPSLLTGRERSLLGDSASSEAGAHALRVALLWDDLVKKLDSNPTAALGLLDIAKSGMVNDSTAVSALEPDLVDAVRRAPFVLESKDAWNFLGAVARKLDGTSLTNGKSAVAVSAGALAEAEPVGALELLTEPDPRGAIESLVPSIAAGLLKAQPKNVGEALSLSAPQAVARVVANEKGLASVVASDKTLLENLTEGMNEIPPSLVQPVVSMILPFLTEDWQLPTSRAIFDDLDPDELRSEIAYLGEFNNFASENMSRYLFSLAEQKGIRDEALETVARGELGDHSVRLLAEFLKPTKKDALWLIENKNLHEHETGVLLTEVSRKASDAQLRSLTADPRVAFALFNALSRNSSTELERAILVSDLNGETLEFALSLALPIVGPEATERIAKATLTKYLQVGPSDNFPHLLSRLLEAIGANFDAYNGIRSALDARVSSKLASRNIQAFNHAPEVVRSLIAEDVQEIARCFTKRRKIDLDSSAIDSLAHLLFHAERVVPSMFPAAAAELYELALRQADIDVSIILVATAPSVYVRMGKASSLPAFLKLIPAFTWDPGQYMLDSILYAFMRSRWMPGNFAFVIWRCGQTLPALERALESESGRRFVDRMHDDLENLPETCRNDTARALSKLRRAKKKR